MIDTLLQEPRQGRGVPSWTTARPRGGRYAVLTLHRPSNVDDPSRVLGGLLDALDEVQRELPVVFPIHPRTRATARGSAWGWRRGRGHAGLRLIDPLGYLDFLKLMGAAAVSC
jgi:UDP-N-acetylglucosamine 2-epimerase (non-hydrolysing)